MAEAVVNWVRDDVAPALAGFLGDDVAIVGRHAKYIAHPRAGCTNPEHALYRAHGSQQWTGWAAGQRQPCGFRGVERKRGADGRFRGTIRVKRGAELEYKLTRGSWETVEKGAHGEEIVNRRLKASEDATVEVVTEVTPALRGGAPAA